MKIFKILALAAAFFIPTTVFAQQTPPTNEFVIVDVNEQYIEIAAPAKYDTESKLYAALTVRYPSQPIPVEQNFIDNILVVYAVNCQNRTYTVVGIGIYDINGNQIATLEGNNQWLYAEYTDKGIVPATCDASYKAANNLGNKTVDAAKAYYRFYVANKISASN